MPTNTEPAGRAKGLKNLTHFKPGNPGRVKGLPNKLTRDVKEMILTALNHAGGAEYLCMQAYDNPKAFLALVGRVLPMQVEGTGQGGAIIVKIEQF